MLKVKVKSFTSVDGILKTLVIDLIGQLSRMLLVVCQLSRDVIGHEDS